MVKFNTLVYFSLLGFTIISIFDSGDCVNDEHGYNSILPLINEEHYKLCINELSTDGFDITHEEGPFTEEHKLHCIMLITEDSLTDAGGVYIDELNIDHKELYTLLKLHEEDTYINDNEPYSPEKIGTLCSFIEKYAKKLTNTNLDAVCDFEKAMPPVKWCKKKCELFSNNPLY